MPKTKTHKGLKKRIKITPTGKILRMRSGKSHLLAKKSSRRKRRLRKKTLIASTEVQRIKRMFKGEV